MWKFKMSFPNNDPADKSLRNPVNQFICKPPKNPFADSSESKELPIEKLRPEDNDDKEYYDEEETQKPQIPRIYAGVTPAPIRQNILYTILPTLQKKTYKYCPYNQYTFATTCRPGRRLRYDLQVFCQEYSEYCGVPNINLYPSQYPQEPYRPAGYGQKQQNGHFGIGRSFGFGLGAIPGFQITASQGADIGPLPGLDQIGGFMLNEGSIVGVLGQQTGREPARTMSSLSSGYPSLGLDPNTQAADRRATNAALRALGIPSLPGIGSILGGLQGPNGKSRKAGPLLDPGYDAVDKKAPFATGKTDGNHVDLPGPLGRIEYYRGVGLGIG
uniref:Uncharacterized protein n=1 Tax=Acrobeloides nanus TaxID=290746 RepID=A0A914CW03_9BILA